MQFPLPPPQYPTIAPDADATPPPPRIMYAAREFYAVHSADRPASRRGEQ